MMKIAIGCDPNAQKEKEEIIAYIEKRGYGEVTDFGSEDVIYAHVAIDVGEAIAAGKYDRGILICGTGIGMSISANKVKGISAALITDVYSAERARLSNAFLGNEFVEGCASQPKVDAFREYDMNRS